MLIIKCSIPHNNSLRILRILDAYHEERTFSVDLTSAVSPVTLIDIRTS